MTCVAPDVKLREVVNALIACDVIFLMVVIGYVVIMLWFLSVQFAALNDAIGCGGIFAIGFEVIADFIAGLGSGEVFPAVSGERLKDEEI